MTQRIAGPKVINDRPFSGEGVSLYAAGAEAFRYRTLRVLAMDGGRGRLDWLKGTGGRHDVGEFAVGCQG